MTFAKRGKIAYLCCSNKGMEVGKNAFIPLFGLIIRLSGGARSIFGRRKQNDRVACAEREMAQAVFSSKGGVLNFAVWC